MNTTPSFANLSSTFPANVFPTLCVLFLIATANNLDGQVPSWQPLGPVIQTPIQQQYYPAQESYIPQEPNVIVGEVVYGNGPISNIVPAGNIAPNNIATETNLIQDYETAPGEYLPEGYESGSSPDLSPTPPSPEIAGRDTSDPNIANEIIRSLEDELFKSHAKAAELYSKVEFLENQLTTSQGQLDLSAESDTEPTTESTDNTSAAKTVADRELVDALSLARQQNSALRAELEKRKATLSQQSQMADRELENQWANEQAATKADFERRMEQARSEFSALQQKLKAEQVARAQQITQLESQLANVRASYEAKDKEYRESAELRRQGDTSRVAQTQMIAQLEAQLTDVRTKMEAKDNAIRATAEMRQQVDTQRAAQAQRIAQLETQLTDVRSKMDAKEKELLKTLEMRQKKDTQRADQAKKIAQLESRLTEVQTSYEAKVKELQNRPMVQPKDSPRSAENPFKRTAENATADENSGKPENQQDDFFEEALLEMQKLHDKMFEEIEAGAKRISERFDRRIQRLDPAAAGFEAEKTRLNRDRQRLIREDELKIRQRWQKKMDSHMESTLETV